MKGKKLYPCFGYEITIDQAADFACVSVAAVRNQLSKLGGRTGIRRAMRNIDEQEGRADTMPVLPV